MLYIICVGCHIYIWGVIQVQTIHSQFCTTSVTCSLTLDWCCWYMHEQESIHASPSYNSPWTMPCSIFTYTSEPTALLTASRTLSHVLGCFPVPSPSCNHFWNMALHRVSTSLWSALTVSRTKGSMSSCNPTSSHFGDTLGTAHLTRSFSCKEPYSAQKQL